MSEAPELEQYPVVVTVPVLWGEVDAWGVVNNVVYYRWFEQARMTYFGRCELMASYERDRIGPILHSTRCRYRKPLTHPATVRVGARVSKVLEDRVEMEYLLVCADDGAVHAEGGAIAVCYDFRRGEKTPLPPNVVDAIARLEAR